MPLNEISDSEMWMYVYALFTITQSFNHKLNSCKFKKHQICLSLNIDTCEIGVSIWKYKKHLNGL